ncbi:MAG: hypothetical protein HZB87_08615, partial [Desulfatitalea sp.]|nr:hypothetical protein [Desulfatitalea sp.]
MPQTLFKHNPAFLSDEALEDQFVIRRRELTLILETIRGNTGAVNQHLLVVAPRGMGKTMLMRRVALALRKDPELSAYWRPIVLPEENYTVATEGELWLRALSYIQIDRDEERQRSILEALKAERNEARLRTQALARLKEIAEACGKRLVVMVENLNTLMEEQAHGNTGWDLRKTLLNEPAIMLLTTATARFDEIENAGKSMFDLFREIKLSPIPTAECIALWKAIAGETLDTTKIRPLEILTGGNPRLLTILASFAGGASFRELMQDLNGLIDDHTTYFKANVEALPPLERKIYATLAEIWSPAGAREIAQQSRLEVSKTSAQFKRLVARGAVVEVARKGRKIFYQIAERLYNIYHLMRQSSTAADRARAVVDFMVRFYDIDRLGGCIAAEGCNVEVADRLLYIGAYNHLLCHYATNRTEREKLLSATPKAFLEIAGLLESLAEEHATSIEEKIISEEAKQAKMLLQQALKAGEKDPLNKIALCDQLVARFGAINDPQIARQVAKALFNKAFALETLERPEDAIAVYDELIQMFSDKSETPILEWVAMAMVGKGVIIDGMGRAEEAMAVYDEVIKRFSDKQQASIKVSLAWALNFKGATLNCEGHPENAIAVYDELIQCCGDSLDPTIAELVAGAMLSKGSILGTMDRAEEEIAVYDELIQLYSDRIEAPIVEQVAIAMVNKGLTLGAMDRPKEEIAVYDALIQRFGDRSEASIVERVATAMFNKGVTLGTIECSEEAIAMYDELAQRFGDRPETSIVEEVAMALFNKGVRLGAMERWEEELAVYDELIQRFGDRPEPIIAERIAKALFNKGFTLGILEHSEEAIAVYDELINRFRDRPEVPIKEQVNWAQLYKGITLGAADCLQEAITAFDNIIKKDVWRDETSLSLFQVGAIVEKTLILLRLRKSEEAIALLRGFLNRPDLWTDHYTQIMNRLIDFASQGFVSETLRMLT